MRLAVDEFRRGGLALWYSPSVALRSRQHLLHRMSAVSMPMPITRANGRTIACGPSLDMRSRRSNGASSICRI